jgi:hypothetical protein
LGGSSAFLLPPGISAINPQDGVSTAEEKGLALKLPCFDCVFTSRDDDKSVEAEGDDDLFWAQGGARDIVLNFALSDDSRALMVNDWQVYPITLDNSDQPTVAEVAASVTLADLQEHPDEATTLAISGASISATEELISAAGDQVVKILYQVVSLEGQPVTVDAAEVRVLEGGDGSLMIISVSAVQRAGSELVGMPFPHPPHPAEGSPKECTMLPAALCRFKGMVESKIMGFRQGGLYKFGGKGCGGRKEPHRLPGHIKPDFDHFHHSEDLEVEDDMSRDGGEGEESAPQMHHGHHPRPPPPHPHGQHGPHGMHSGSTGAHRHHHHGHHHFLHRFLGAFVSILIPVIAGITMGMFVSLLGMAAGRLIAFLWIKFRRGGKRGYASLAQTEVEDNSLEKGATVVMEEEPLPKYEDAPAYEEKQ